MENLPSTGTQQIGDQDLQLINRLFLELKTIFPAWRNAFKTQKEVDLCKVTWTKGLIEGAVTDWEYIEGGLRVARRSPTDFIPSIGKFLSWCKQEITKDIPDITEAKAESVRYTGVLSHKWSHPVVYDAAIRCGRNNLQSMKTEKLDKYFKYCYDISIDFFLSGKAMAKPTQQEMLPPPNPLSREESKVHIDNLKDILNR